MLSLLELKRFSQSNSKILSYSGGSKSLSIDKLTSEEEDFFFQEETIPDLDLIIRFNNIDLHFFAENDSFSIKNTSLKNSDNERRIEGRNGVLKFQREIDFVGTPSLQLEYYRCLLYTSDAADE